MPMPVSVAAAAMASSLLPVKFSASDVAALIESSLRQAERFADFGDGVFAERGDDLAEVDVQHC